MSVSAETTGDAVYDSTGLIVQCPQWRDIPWLRHAGTTREFAPADALRFQEMRQLQHHLGLGDLPVCYGQQRHTTNVGVVDQTALDHCSSEGRFIFKETDAIVSPLPNVSIGVVTADCAPIILFDEVNRVIAAAHAGWRGTLGRIVDRTVRTMREEGADGDIHAWIGPMIGGCCYEVSPEMIAQFREQFEDAASAGVQFASGRLLDLVGLNEFQLRRCGVAHVHVSGICTMHQRERFFSYRAEGQSAGRIVTMITAIS